MKSLLRKTAKLFGVPPTGREDALPKDMPDYIKEIYHMVEPFTMTSPERVNALITAIDYIASNDIPGDMVECGVWRGGSMMAVAQALLRWGIEDRNLLLYDTFEGMSPPKNVDADLAGRKASTLLEKADPETSHVWARANLGQVKENMSRTGYPRVRMSFIQGKVQDTLPARAPERIALLRLDTDWYDSTRHELEHLFPRLVPGGILIVDDYGHWQGARKAVDEYLEFNGIALYLNRIDYTGRVAVKCTSAGSRDD